MENLIPFAAILMIGLLIPEIFNRFKITAVPLLIIAGIIIGPYGLELVEISDEIEFIANLGLLFLVFIAGLEIFESKKLNIKDSTKLAVINITFCFLIGFFLGHLFGFETKANILLGTIFISSSVGEIIPMVNQTHILRAKFANVVIPAVIIMDATSLIIFSTILKWDSSYFEIILFFMALFLFISISLFVIPKIMKKYSIAYKKGAKELDTRLIIAILFGIIAISIKIHLHPILAAFIAGVVLGETVSGEKVFLKLEGIGYGFLIPIFFIFLGLEMNIAIIFEKSQNILLTIFIVLGLLIAKVLGGIIYSKLKKINIMDGMTTGMLLWPQLSTTVAVASIAKAEELIPEELFVAVLVMAIVTTLGTPFVIGLRCKTELERVKLKKHTIVLGCGRVGRQVVDALIESKEDFIVVDNNLNNIEELQKKWVQSVYGDASDLETLAGAGVDKAKLVIVALPDSKESVIAVDNIKKLNMDCYIIVRVHGKREAKILVGEVDEIIEPEVISGMNVVWHALKFLGKEDIELKKFVEIKNKS